MKARWQPQYITGPHWGKLHFHFHTLIVTIEFPNNLTCMSSSWKTQLNPAIKPHNLLAGKPLSLLLGLRLNSTFSSPEDSPWDSSRFQLVGDVHVPGPDVKLPLPQPQDATQHRARVDPDAHVNVMFRARAHISD